jgi:hypothetical protein
VQFATQVVFPASPADVADMLATEAYVLEKVAASGATDGSVDIVRSPDGSVTITSHRRMPTTDIPATYRSLIGSSLEVREVDAWEAPEADGARRGTIALEVTGAPVRVSGTLELQPTGDTETVLRIAGDIKASVPFFGKAIERALADSVEHAADVERQAGLRWLAER